jgi:hypothetical protein
VPTDVSFNGDEVGVTKEAISLCDLLGVEGGFVWLGVPVKEDTGVSMVAVKIELALFGFCSVGGVEAACGSKTTQTKPVSRPLEHSCRNAIMSQN